MEVQGWLTEKDILLTSHLEQDLTVDDLPDESQVGNHFVSEVLIIVANHFNTVCLYFSFSISPPALPNSMCMGTNILLIAILLVTGGKCLLAPQLKLKTINFVLPFTVNAERV